MEGDIIEIKEIEGIEPMLLIDLLLKIADANNYGYSVSLVMDPEKN